MMTMRSRGPAVVGQIVGRDWPAIRVRRNVSTLLGSLVFLLASMFTATAHAAGFSAAASLATARNGHTATLLTSGKVLVVGGTGAGYLSSAELYDPATNNWAAAAPLATGRVVHSATLLPSGKVLVAGGIGNSGYLSSAELYDPATNTWAAAAPLATGRSFHTATLLPSGKVLVVGGTSNSGIYQFSAELYDPATNTWSAAALMARARASHTATLLPSGKVLVAGGDYAGLANAEMYDPVTNAWAAAGSMATARNYHTATLLPSGKVLVAGGRTGSIFASAELYDSATNTWVDAGAMATAREDYTATLLPSGKVLVAGGSNSSSVGMSSAELYDPATNMWVAAASMATARTGQTATRLPSGQVLVTGGFGNGGYLSSAELYDRPFDADQFALSGTWYNPTTSGQGVLLEVYADRIGAGMSALGAGWFTYDTSGHPQWYTIQGTMTAAHGGVYGIDIYQAIGGSFNAPTPTQNTKIGSGTFTFSDCTHAALIFTMLDGRAGTIPYTRMSNASNCSMAVPAAAQVPVPANYNDVLHTGAWYDPATSGQGLLVDIVPSQTTLFAAWYTYAPASAGLSGTAAQRWFTLQTNAYTPGNLALTNVPIYASSGGVFNTASPVTITRVGSANVTISSCDVMTIGYTFSDGEFKGQSGSLHMQTLGVPPGCQ